MTESRESNTLKTKMFRD